MFDTVGMPWGVAMWSDPRAVRGPGEKDLEEGTFTRDFCFTPFFFFFVKMFSAKCFTYLFRVFWHGQMLESVQNIWRGQQKCFGFHENVHTLKLKNVFPIVTTMGLQPSLP